MNWLKKTYRAVVDHLTKILGIAGTALLGADATGYLEGIKAAAQQYLPPDIALQIGKWTGIILFAGVFARGLYAGWKANQLKQQLAIAQAALPPVQVIPVTQAPQNPTTVAQP